MAENTKIEWADATVNHWAGCTKVSPACDNCYAERMAGRLWKVQWGAGAARRQFISARDMLEALDRKAQRIGKKLRVFHNSLSDMFDNEVPDGWRMDAFKIMADTPNLQHLVLTKRIGNVMKMANEVADMPRLGSHTGHLIAHQWRNGSPPKNVWLGATVVNQEEADRDIPKLLAVPAVKRFLSIEPMLGPINIEPYLLSTYDKAAHDDQMVPGLPTTDRLDWIIVGGESGPGARPMHPDWVRSVRDQCDAAGVPFLFKQWGEWGPDWEGAETCGSCGGSKFDFINSYGECGRCGVDSWVAAEKPLDSPRRVGKKAAGRLLDGRTHDGFPATQDAKEAGS